MKSLLSACILVFLLLAVAVSALRVGPSNGRRFATLKDEAADFASLSTLEYVERLEAALRHAPENQELMQHLNYYRGVGASVKQSVRDTTKGTVHDCVPFDMQPALFEASAEQIKDAREHWLSATLGGLSSTQAVCHPGSVPIARPVVKYAGSFTPKLSVAPPKQAPKNLAVNGKRDPIPAGYSYIDSDNLPNPSDTNYTYTILGMGKAVNSSIPSTPFLNDADHSINQMWWVDQNQLTNTLDTLEAGWIHSSYWSFFPETMLFVFSTPDGYQGPGNKYNHAGGFIGYPGAPALQKGVEEVMYMWKYEKLFSAVNGSVTGFAQKLTPFSVNANGSYIFDTEIPLGYYPVYRYKNHTAPDFSGLQTGQEMSENTNSTALLAGGKIFGWGTDTQTYDIRGNFTNFGQKMNFTYGTTPGFESNTAHVSASWIAFHGNDCGKHC